MNEDKKTIYVLVPLEVTITDGGVHPIHHRTPKSYEIENMIRAGHSFKTEQEAINRLNNKPSNSLRLRFADAKLMSNLYPNNTCKACNRKLGAGLIRYHKEIGGLHEECWLTK